MNLLLMRHAEASSVGGAIASDAERPLTPRGEAQALSIAEQILGKHLSVQAVICSPLERCVQTALIVGRSLGLPEVYPHALLSPYGFLPDIGPILDVYKEQSLLLIGHHPDIGLLATSMNAPEFLFGTATMVWFRRDPGESRWRYAEVFRPYASL